MHRNSKCEFVDPTEEHSYYVRHDQALEQIKYLKTRVYQLQRQNVELQNKSHVDIDNILRNKFLLNFYTGFPLLSRFECFKRILKDHAHRYRIQYNVTYETKLGDDVEIFVFLTRLRLGLLELDIATRHNISLSVTSKIINFWLNVSYSYIKQVPFWPKKMIVQKYMPTCFSKLYPNTRIILDATEILIEKPSDYNIQSSKYSSYKSHNTAKGLIGITPNGFTAFVSDLYPGRISDKEMFLKSGLLNLLEPGDSVMADRGFTVAQELNNIGVHLNIPPFLGGAAQLDETNLQTTRDIARK